MAISQQPAGTCESLRALDLSGWCTQNVISVKEIFCGCKSLEVLDISGWCFDEIVNCEYSFTGCELLSRIDAFGCDDNVLNWLIECAPATCKIMTDNGIVADGE